MQLSISTTSCNINWSLDIKSVFAIISFEPFISSLYSRDIPFSLNLSVRITYQWNPYKANAMMNLPRWAIRRIVSTTAAEPPPNQVRTSKWYFSVSIPIRGSQATGNEYSTSEQKRRRQVWLHSRLSRAVRTPSVEYPAHALCSIGQIVNYYARLVCLYSGPSIEHYHRW